MKLKTITIYVTIIIIIIVTIIFFNRNIQDNIEKEVVNDSQIINKNFTKFSKLNTNEIILFWCEKIKNKDDRYINEFNFYKFFWDVTDKKTDITIPIEYCNKNFNSRINNESPFHNCKGFVNAIREKNTSYCNKFDNNITDKNFCLTFIEHNLEYCQNAGVDCYTEDGFNKGIEKSKNRIKMLSSFRDQNKKKCFEITDTKLLSYCLFAFDKKCIKYNNGEINSKTNLIINTNSLIEE